MWPADARSWKALRGVFVGTCSLLSVRVAGLGTATVAETQRTTERAGGGGWRVLRRALL